MITSPANARLKLVRTLHSRKGREKQRAFLAEGVRLLEEARQSGQTFRFVLYAQPLSERAQALCQALQADGVVVEEVEPRLLRSVSDTETPQNLLAVLDWPRLQPAAPEDFVLIPDALRDPGNLGTLLRTAVAAGAQAVWIPPGTTDPFAPKVVRAGMGAHFRIPIVFRPWDEIQALAAERGLTLFLADMHGSQSCWEADLHVPLGLILGGEAAGASAAARKAARHSLHIPMPGPMESLNAAVAGAILLFEVARQRLGRTY